MKIDFINNIDNIYAHKCFRYGHQEKETLENHLNNTFLFFERYDNMYNILNNIKKAVSNMTFVFSGKKFVLSEKALSLFEDMFKNAIYLHDIGKINPNFQRDKMENDIVPYLEKIQKKDIVKEISYIDSNHSLLSGIIYINQYIKEIKKIKNGNEAYILLYILFMFANSICCHHTSLENMEGNLSKERLKEELSKLKNSNYVQLALYKETIDINPSLYEIVLNKMKDCKFDKMIFYICNKILYSLICNCDFLATNCFFKNEKVSDYKFNFIENKNNLINTFEKSSIYQGIQSYKKDNNYFKNNKLPLINEIRSDIFLETKNNIHNNKDKRIFTLESPTGSGKTFNSISCFLELLNNKSKLFYILPINTIATQTKEVMNGIFGEVLDIHEINSITPLPLGEDKSIDYNKILLDRQILNYESIITSNITFFDLLFGTTRNKSIGLISLFNSVIILDEIQNYNNKIWKEMIEFLYRFSEIMNFKLVIMSATLPNLEKLIDSKSEKFIQLLQNPKKYYENPLFKNRVKINKELLSCDISLNILKQQIVNETKKRNNLLEEKYSKKFYSKVLIEFITKKSARDFYKEVKEQLTEDFDIYELDGDDNDIKKENIIRVVKGEPTNKNMLLITTQIIEAGVDIDMDIGFKDAVFPDVDEQFLGRINRSCKKEFCDAYFFNFDNEKNIYQGDFRLGKNIKYDNFLKCLEDKDFNYFYNKVFLKFYKEKDKIGDSEIDKFYSSMVDNKNKEIENHMKLIEDNTFSIFIPSIINDIDGKKVWSKYIKLIENKEMSYAKKKVLLINIRKDMKYFVYNIYGQGIQGKEAVGGIYYIDDNEYLDEEGKFDLDCFKKDYFILK